MTKQHNYAFDLLRIIAILCVLFNHQPCCTCVEVYTGISPIFIIKLLLSILCKIGPPLFFAISGALLLGKEEKFSYILNHRILRMLILMASCTIILLIRTNDFSDPINVFFTKLSWYFYAYVGYLIMLFFLRKITLNINVVEAKLFITLSFVFYTLWGICTFFRFEQYFLTYIQLFTAGWASHVWHIIFPISGYCLILIYKSKTETRFLLFLIIGTVFDLVLSTSFFISTLIRNAEVDLEMMKQFFIYFPTLLIFYLFISVPSIQKIERHTIIAKIIAELSSASLGVFLIETHVGITPIITSKINLFIDKYFFISDYIKSYIDIACIFVLYSVVTIIIRRIPFMKKIL